MLLRWVRVTIPVKRQFRSILVGRPRKLCKRYPNGQPVRAYVNPKKQVAMQPHRSEVMKKYREFPEAESAFGRLMLNGHITPAQHAAGASYAKLARQYARIINSRSPHPSGIDMDRVTGGGHDGEMPDHVAKAIGEKYNRTYESLVDRAGDKSQRIVKDAVVLDKTPETADGLARLKCGLDVLITLFAIDKGLQITNHSINAR